MCPCTLSVVDFIFAVVDVIFFVNFFSIYLVMVIVIVLGSSSEDSRDPTMEILSEAKRNVRRIPEVGRKE